MRTLPSRWTTLSVALALGASGCLVDTVYVDVDPPVDYGDEPAYVPSGEPTLEIGYYDEQLYAPLRDGGECPIIFGLQGGTWTMPALRAKGVDTTLTVHCTLVTEADEQLGEAIERNVRFYLAPDGWIENQAFPVPAVHAPPNEADPIDDLYGQDATLACSVRDSEERTAEASVRCTLVEG